MLTSPQPLSVKAATLKTAIMSLGRVRLFWYTVIDEKLNRTTQQRITSMQERESTSQYCSFIIIFNCWINKRLWSMFMCCEKRGNLIKSLGRFWFTIFRCGDKIRALNFDVMGFNFSLNNARWIVKKIDLKTYRFG